jgi:hypothetical protein
MRQLTERIVLLSLIALAALVVLYPRVPAPAPLFRARPRRGEAAPPAPRLDGPRMPTYRPPGGSMERMPIAAPPGPGHIEVVPQPAKPIPHPGPTD